MEDVAALPRTIEGLIRLRRTSRVVFPTEELIGHDGLLARLGRDSSMRIFFGAGRQVQLTDGTEWRIKAAASGRYIVPLVRSDAGLIVISGVLPAKRSYGINGKNYGYTLIPVGRVGLRGPGIWTLRRHETQIATIDDHERVIHASEPIPIAATLMAFTLITHGIPGEADLMPRRD